jgi:hypothetical protein
MFFGRITPPVWHTKAGDRHEIEVKFLISISLSFRFTFFSHALAHSPSLLSIFMASVVVVAVNCFQKLEKLTTDDSFQSRRFRSREATDD